MAAEPDLPTTASPELLARVGDLWVLDKPAGYAVHPTGEGIPDLMAWARESLSAPAGISPIHRLDRDTSGVVLCSAEPALLSRLGKLFGGGGVVKRYQALVHGRTHKKGIIRRPLPDRRRGRPLPAVTRFRRLAWFGATTLLEVRPESGRRHQIRRHLHGLGHPVVGDRRYRGSRTRPVPGFPGRLWLHALAIELPDGQRFEAPLPPELTGHLSLLGATETRGS